ncbi:MAG: VCBS repeat-containing protein [Ignavibacteriales bacterium]|nr:VCBS repeat-containing protein [Ignavibacteriales bacterium]
MKLRLILVCVLFCYAHSLTQLRQGERILRKEYSPRQNLEIPNPQLRRPLAASSISDTLRVLAIMVDFRTDSDNLTSGNGKFQLDTAITGLIDPPPHDSAFFARKLEFVQNYFRKVSNGKLVVKGDVLGRVITLPNAMSSYAPVNNNSTNRGLANMAVEGWRAADSLVPSIPFSQYNAFVLFHAGVGRDIDVVGLLGFDPTPNDIPSLYLGLESLRNALQNPAFPGIQTQSGFLITNTAILPETETRVFSLSGTTDTLQLSINGLTVASIGSHLGLPDLFDTKTGRQGIGQFGLMDGASIFAYYGIFPPEPSAWEKVYLGWVRPIVIDSTTTNIVVPAVGLMSVGEDTIYKVPISESEYFLVENRNRDPQKNGQRLTIYEKLNGIETVRTQSFVRDTTNFAFDNIDAVSGSVIDVEDFDWALIGSIDGTEKFDGGGILIWHIDDDIIRAGLATNSVNADPAQRGVDLEEADGSQDIGQVYEFLEPGAATTSGSPLDCWFEGNVASPYKNLFDRNSFPNSNSNSGARTLVSFKDFTRRDPVMFFTVQIGDNLAVPLTGFPKQVQGELNSVVYPVDLNNDGTVEFAASRFRADSAGVPLANGDILAWKQDGTEYFRPQDSSAIVAEIDTAKVFQMAFAKHPQSGENYIAAAAQDGLYLWKVSDQNSDFRFDRVFKKPLSASNVMFVDTIVVSSGAGSGLASFDLSGNQIASYSSTVAGDVARVGSTDNVAAGLGDTLLLWNVRSGQAISKKNVLQNGFFISTGSVLGNGQTQIVVLTSERLFLLDAAGNEIMTSNEFTRYLPGSDFFSVGPSLVDLDKDGKKEIVMVSNFGILIALNSNGFLADGFPVNPRGLPYEQRFGPTVGDVNGDGIADFLYCDENGRVLNILDGASKRNTRLQVGDGMLMPTLFPVGQSNSAKTGLALSSRNGKILALDLQTSYAASTILWPMFRFDVSQSSFAALQTPSTQPLAVSFFPRNRVYNWPNPVYGTVTQIRYYTGEDAEISVKIFDLAGAKVAELKGKSFAGTDSELSWDVSNIQSGVYLARVEAIGASANDVAVIKIAVVK